MKLKRFFWDIYRRSSFVERTANLGTKNDVSECPAWCRGEDEGLEASSETLLSHRNIREVEWQFKPEHRRSGLGLVKNERVCRLPSRSARVAVARTGGATEIQSAHRKNLVPSMSQRLHGSDQLLHQGKKQERTKAPLLHAGNRSPSSSALREPFYQWYFRIIPV